MNPGLANVNEARQPCRAGGERTAGLWSYDCGDRRQLIPAMVGEVKNRQRNPGQRKEAGLASGDGKG